MSTQPTDAELIAELEVAGVAFMKFRGGLGGTKEVWTTSGSQDAKKIAQGMRAAIAKWGQSAQAAEPVARMQPRKIDECYGDCPTNPATCPNPCKFLGRTTASHGQAPATVQADSVQEDAARYRWLREGNDAKHGAAWYVAVNLYGCEWDAAIDAARKQGEKHDR